MPHDRAYWNGREGRHRRYLKETRRGKASDRRLDARPFAQWLYHTMLRDGLSAADVHRLYKVDAVSVHRMLRGEKRLVALSTVDRALAQSETGLWELYDLETLTPKELHAA